MTSGECSLETESPAIEEDERKGCIGGRWRARSSNRRRARDGAHRRDEGVSDESGLISPDTAGVRPRCLIRRGYTSWREFLTALLIAGLADTLSVKGTCGVAKVS